MGTGVRGGGSGRAAAPPVLKNYRANSVFRAGASCSKILNDKKYIISTVNSGQLCFSGQAHASCSKLLNVKNIFNTVKNSRESLFFRASAKLLTNPEW